MFWPITHTRLMKTTSTIYMLWNKKIVYYWNSISPFLILTKEIFIITNYISSTLSYIYIYIYIYIERERERERERP